MTSEIRVLSLHDYIRIFRSQTVPIAVAVALCLSVATVLSALATPQYRAEARVRVEPAASSLIGESTNIASNVRDRNLQNEVDFAESDRVANRARSDFGDRIEAQVSPAGSSDKLIFASVDPDADRAAAIANTWANAFVAERTASAGERYLSSLVVIDVRLAEIAEERRQLQAQQSASAENTARAAQIDALDRAEVGLRNQLNDLDVLIELNQNGTVSILNSAVTPDSPFSPNWPLNIALGLLAGFLLGAGLAIARHSLDDTISQPDALRAATDEAPVLANVPSNSSPDPNNQSPSFTEAFRALQLGIEFSKTQGTQLKSILVTSPNAGEGKSTIASNLAIAYARSGSSVLLIDADMHNTSQASFFDVPNAPGLADQLEGRQGTIHSGEQKSGSENMWILPAGDAHAPPSQLLSSVEALSFIGQLSERYDIIIIDSPPLLPVADTRTLARLADATLLVARADQTTQSQMKDAMELLHQVRVSPLGSILNGFELGSGYYYGKGIH